MGGTRGRLARIVTGSTVVGLATLMLGAVPAHAVGESTISYVDGSGDITVTGTGSVENDIVETGDGTAIAFEDANGWVVAAGSEDSCAVDGGDPTLVVCEPDGVDDAAVADIVINLGAGNDSYNFGGGTPTGSTLSVRGSSGNDVLNAGDSNNQTLRGGVGDDTVNGGSENDLLYGEDPGSTQATVANDTINGGDGDDLLDGGPGNDTLNGGLGNDTLNGGGSNDGLDGGAGDDVMNGGSATDTAKYGSRTAAVNVSLDGVANDGEAGELDNVGNDVENVTTGSAADTITGNSLASRLKGQGGNDTINGGSGADLLYGGDGGDTLTGSTGSDKLYGNAGNDHLYARGDATRDWLYCATGTDGYLKDAGTTDILDKCETNEL